MPATLTVNRETNFAMELHRGRFDVAVDGENVGTLDLEGTLRLPVDPGHHTLQVRDGRYSSRACSFDVADGGAVTFRTNGARLWPMYLASLVKPDLGLILQQVTAAG